MSPTALGTLYCILSAIFYTLMEICRRELSANCDPVWVNCVQASVSTVVFGIYLTLRSAHGRSAWPSLGIAVGLMTLGAITQLGATSYQWSLGIIGLSIGNPLQMGIMLASAAIMGRILLGERVSWQATAAIVLITVSIVFLGSGAESTGEAVQAADANANSSVTTAVDDNTSDPINDSPSSSGPFLIVIGIAAACFAGMAFALLTVGMRKTVTDDTSPEAIVFFINCMGILFLGPWAMWNIGINGMLATSPRDLAVMLAAGACNLLAFLLIAKALQLTTVVRVNVINNAMATALTVLAGIAIFAEPCSRELIIGITLILTGIVLISYQGPSDGETENTESTDVKTCDSTSE
ncbi:MAG: DMT family transporter [Pirellulales bacterium]|nr:DMT family transporter [Pirellulales bacterium]